VWDLAAVIGTHSHASTSRPCRRNAPLSRPRRDRSIGDQLTAATEMTIFPRGPSGPQHMNQATDDALISALRNVAFSDVGADPTHQTPRSLTPQNAEHRVDVEANTPLGSGQNPSCSYSTPIATLLPFHRIRDRAAARQDRSK